jgi:hypothetical protein
MRTCLKERSEREFIQNNRDPYKKERKIPPPHPDKRKNINYFSSSRGPYFLLSYTVNLCVFYFYKLIGKLTDSLHLQKFSLFNLVESTSGQFHYHHTEFSSHLKSKHL